MTVKRFLGRQAPLLIGCLSHQKNSLMPSRKTLSEQMTSDATPTNGEVDFEEPFEAQKSSSVYDFLYQDVRRVGSFLAQFEEHGVRQSVRASEAVGRTEMTRTSATATLGIPALAGGTGLYDVNTSDETKDLSEHNFDPLWANSRRLLNYLTTNDLIASDVWDTPIGRFILLSGLVAIVDTSTVNGIYNNPDLQTILLAGMFKEMGEDPASDKAKAFASDLAAVMQLPSNIQMFVFGDKFRSWSSLTNESLVTSASDLAFKHGAMVRGHWKVLGILDAFPDEKSEASENNPDPKTLDELGAEMITAPIAQIAAKVANMARNSLGRPRDHFGITPLLIFREVSGED